MSAFFRWLTAKRISIAKTWFFSWPSASGDVCMICNKKRDEHRNMAHPFVEY